MAALTIQQRNLLRQLLDSASPVAIAHLAPQNKLTPRQINYRLKPIKNWLAQRNVTLKATPGVGIEIICSPRQRLDLLQELDSVSNFQLNLAAGQRQQLFALNLLTAVEPLILNQFQYIASVSRTTVLRDLEPVERWLHQFELALIRRPNYGLLLDGAELARRQALAALLWGDAPFDEPLIQMTYDRGLIFSLADEARLLPIVKQADKLLSQWNTQAAFEWVAEAEAQLGGRFTDDAVLHLALAFALQAQRVRAGQFMHCPPETLDWLVRQSVWSIAVNLSRSIWPNLAQETLTADIAGIGMYLLAGLRDHIQPGDLDIDPAMSELIQALLAEVAQAFNTPELRHDPSLRDGLVAHIIPEFMRQRFGLWAPPSWSDGALSRQYQYEYEIARELALVVTEHSGVVLPDGQIDTLTLLLRAAFIRERPNRLKRVYIICPSGMATAQLLVARLKARFPNLEILGVLSLRELSSQQVAGAQLLISTIPLHPPIHDLHVIQVHPLLLPKDIEAITQWLTWEAVR